MFVHAADAARARTGEKPKVALGPVQLGLAFGFLGYSIRKNGLRTRYLGEVIEIGDGDVLDLPGSPVIVGMPGHSPGSVAVHVPLADAVFVAPGRAVAGEHPGRRQSGDPVEGGERFGGVVGEGGRLGAFASGEDLPGGQGVPASPARVGEEVRTASAGTRG
ncbi:hypothetical protein AB0J71_38830 [Nonomuraea sp. NPDC049637]|uniref:hypothetical protein n=1 Tax=Nonomuraea sp. NPDC049637 TaxID=3154356 RepID=UPI00341E9C67